MPGGKGVVGVTRMVCLRQSTGWGSSSVDVVNTKNMSGFLANGNSLVGAVSCTRNEGGDGKYMCMSSL